MTSISHGRLFFFFLNLHKTLSGYKLSFHFLEAGDSLSRVSFKDSVLDHHFAWPQGYYSYYYSDVFLMAKQIQYTTLGCTIISAHEFNVLALDLALFLVDIPICLLNATLYFVISYLLIFISICLLREGCFSPLSSVMLKEIIF